MEDANKPFPDVVVKKKIWYKKKWPYIALVVALILGSAVFGKIFSGGDKTSYETAKAERGTLRQTVDGSGNVESADELDLRFETSGRVGNIYKPVGSQVKQGETIISLDLQELNSRVARASAAVAGAQANLNKEIAGNTDEQLNNLKAKLDQAKANLAQVEGKYIGLLSDARADLDTAESNLKLSEGGEQSRIVEDSYDDLIAVLQSVQTILADALVEADNILGVDNSYANDEFETVLSLLDINKLATAQTKYKTSKISKEKADLAINKLNGSSLHTEMDIAADLGESALLDAKEMLYWVAAVLENTRPIGDLSQSELDTLKSGVQTDRTSLATKYATLVDQEQAVFTAKNSYTTYKIAYERAKSDLESTEMQAAADIDAYKALVEQAEANLKDAQNPPREVDVAGYRAALREAQANLAEAVANRNKATIVAPVSGMVGKIEKRVGEYVSSQDDVVKLISPHFEVKVDIPETDIVKISMGNKADIKLDAYGDDVKFEGEVVLVEKGQTVIQDVIYYTVTLSLIEREDYEILTGMTASVVFYTEEKSGVIIIPQKAVRSGENGRYVKVKKGDEITDVAVKLGLRGDDGLVEVVEGLSEGDEVVVKIIENK